MNEVEEWRDVVGYEHLLQVSNFGRVKSKRRQAYFKDGRPHRQIPGRILIAGLDRLGYPRLRLYSSVGKKSIRVHRMVAKAFIPNPEGKPQVNHINGIKHDNSVSNLEWVTNSENQLHAVSKGLRRGRVGAESSLFTGAVEVYDKAGTLVHVLSGNADMSLKGFDFRLVSACLHGKRKSHRGCTFKKIRNSNV